MSSTLSVLLTKLMQCKRTAILGRAVSEARDFCFVCFFFVCPIFLFIGTVFTFHFYIAELQAKCRTLFSLLKVLTYTPILTVTITYPGAAQVN